MSAVITLDQAGLSAGVPGQARDDGLATGAKVTLTSSAHNNSFEFKLLWVGFYPTQDINSIPSLQQEGVASFSFLPTPGVYGSWLVELVTDRGTAAEDRSTKVFAIKQSPTAIRIPAPNEKGDPVATIQNNGATQRARADFNQPEASGIWVGGVTVSWWRILAELAWRANGGSGGFGGLLFTDQKTANYAAVIGEHVLMVGGFTVSLPAASSAPNGRIGVLSVSGTPIVDAAGSDTIMGAGTYVFSAVDQSAIFQSDGVDTWRIVSAYAGGGA